MRLSRQMVVHGIWLSGLGLTIGLGILARETLSARGVDVVQGISLFQAMTYTCPGGFAEVVGMMIALSSSPSLR